MHALFDKVKWVLYTAKHVAVALQSPCTKTQPTTVVEWKNRYQKFKKYKLPKRFTKIKWNSTWPTSGSSGNGSTIASAQRATERGKNIYIWSELLNCAIHIAHKQAAFCWWLTPSTIVSNSNLSFRIFANCCSSVENGCSRPRERERARETESLLLIGYKALHFCSGNLWHVCCCRCRINVRPMHISHLWIAAAIIISDNFRNEILNAIWLN